MHKTLVIAHRGVKENKHHENTLEAFNEAIKMNLDAIELDIQKTVDGYFVVHHDSDINGILISKLKYDELSLHANNYIIPLIDEVINLCKGKIYLDIELKEEGYETEFIKHILQYLDYNDFAIRSFNDKSIKIIKKYDKNIRTGLLLGVGKAKYGLITRISELFPIFRVLNTKCDFVSPHYLLIKLGYVKRMHMMRKPVITWTVNASDVMTKHIKMKVDGIITDKPSLLLDVLNTHNSN